MCCATSNGGAGAGRRGHGVPRSTWHHCAAGPIPIQTAGRRSAPARRQAYGRTPPAAHRLLLPRPRRQPLPAKPAEANSACCPGTRGASTTCQACRSDSASAPPAKQRKPTPPAKPAEPKPADPTNPEGKPVEVNPTPEAKPTADAKPAAMRSPRLKPSRQRNEIRTRRRSRLHSRESQGMAGHPRHAFIAPASSARHRIASARARSRAVLRRPRCNFTSGPATSMCPIPWPARWIPRAACT